MINDKTVFMVDDDLAICDFIGRAVEKKGYRFQSLNRMEGALDTIIDKHPDLILLDLHLPDGSGLHLCKDIRNNPSTCDIPIFMLTTREFSIERDMALQAGVLAFIQKPLNINDFISQVDEALSPSVSLKFWGVRGSTPCANRENVIYGGNTSCVQVMPPNTDELLIFDSGSGIRNLGNNIVSKNTIVNGRIFITHAHWDHIQGFPFFKPVYVPDNKFDIHLPEQMIGGAKDVLSGQMTYTYFPVTPEMLQAKLVYHSQNPRIQDYGKYQIEFMLSNHPVATAIYKIYCEGKVIIYCPDNELVPENNGQKIPYKEHLRKFIKDADVVIHDAQYDRAGYPQKKNWGHSAWEDAVELCVASDVKSLFLTHHDPDSTDTYLEELDHKLDAYRGNFETLKVAREGYLFKMRIEHNQVQVNQ
ncbi:MAG: response regulator [Balneolales bacterium]